MNEAAVEMQPLDPNKRLPEIENLHKELITQLPKEPDLVTVVVEAYNLHHSEFAKQNKPMASILLLGAKGTDNLAPLRKIAAVLSGSENKLFTINAQDYTSKDAVASLLNSSITHEHAASPGKSTYEENALLGNENLSDYRSPEGITLMAVSGIKTGKEPLAKLLLAPLGTGKLSVQREGEVDFTNKIVFILVDSEKKDFNTSQFESNRVSPEQRTKSILASKKFPNELVGRIDNFIVLKELRDTNP